MKYKLTLLKKTEIVRNVGGFYFKKPKGFTFKAGQFAELKFFDTDPHYFSIASAPYQEDLLFVTRKSNSPFKKELFNLPIGGEIDVSMPFGNFTLHPERNIPAVFFAGGIGITPFLSIIRQATHDKLQHYQYLFYVNKTTQDALFYSHSQPQTVADREIIMNKTLELVKQQEPFIVEFFNLRMKNDYLDFTPFAPMPVNIEAIPDWQKAKYYLCGSPKSIEHFKKLLETMKIDKLQIKTEDFPGYAASF